MILNEGHFVNSVVILTSVLNVKSMKVIYGLGRKHPWVVIVMARFVRNVMNPRSHTRINARSTRQICVECDEPTERCEGALWVRDKGPFCEECYCKRACNFCERFINYPNTDDQYVWDGDSKEGPFCKQCCDKYLREIFLGSQE